MQRYECAEPDWWIHVCYGIVIAQRLEVPFQKSSGIRNFYFDSLICVGNVVKLC